MTGLLGGPCKKSEMSRVLFSIYVWTVFVLLFLLFFVIISAVYILTLPFDRYKRTTNRLLGMMAWCMMHVSPGWKINIRGQEKFNPDESTIFIANHESFMDIPLTYQLPWKMKWVVKRSMSYIPVMGWLVILTGHLTINRTSKSAIKKLSNLVKPIKDKVPVMIFPEGTRSLDGNIKSFKNGAFLLAMEHGFKIQPIAIEGAHEALASGSKLFNPVCTFNLSVLDSIDPKDFQSMTELKEYARNKIIEEQERLQKLE